MDVQKLKSLLSEGTKVLEDMLQPEDTVSGIRLKAKTRLLDEDDTEETVAKKILAEDIKYFSYFNAEVVEFWDPQNHTRKVLRKIRFATDK